VMAILGEETRWLSSTTGSAKTAQRKVSRSVNSIVRSCSSNVSSWVHPTGVMEGSKVGDVPDEPRQWCAFEYADIMEQGLSGGLACSFVEVPEKEVRLCIERSQDRKEFLLTTPEGTRLLLARRQDNGDGFSIFVTRDGEPPKALGPAFTLTPNDKKDRWALQAKTCDQCQSRGRRLCGSRELAFMSHHMEEVGQGQICCLDMEIPELLQDGLQDVWCPVCRGTDAEQKFVELTTRRPKWNARKKTLSMDFYGRCSMASSKNIQLEVVGKPEKVRMLFGKVAENSFVLDFHRPLSMIQAFAAAVSTNVWK